MRCPWFSTVTSAAKPCSASSGVCSKLSQRNGARCTLGVLGRSASITLSTRNVACMGASMSCQAVVCRPARRSSVGLKARRALPRPRWRVRMFRASGASCAQRGRVRSRRRCASWCVRMLRASPAPAGLRALSADVYVRAGVARPGVCACSAPAPRRAESTKGAAAPSHWGMRMLRASPASAGLRALSVGVYVRAGVVRLDGCACGALNFLSMHDCTLRACHG